jgi:MoxR-like ATPase
MAQTATDVAQRLQAGFARIVVGNEGTVFALLVALLAGGHIQLEGVPGTAKTLFVRMLARMLGLGFRRIAFTPDLMPSDVVGTTVFDQRSATFSLRLGPLFTNVLLADEINRTPPKTQSALLEAMEERQATIDGEPHALPAPFMVCATQNPVEYEGTYPLPEAQLDRFMLRSRTAYPSARQERELIARAVAGFDARDLEAAGVTTVASAADVETAQADVRAVFLADALQGYVYAIVAATRTAGDIALGASPRAALALVRATQAAAAIDGRAFATPDDVKAVAPLVLEHRLIVRPEAELDAVDARAVVARILAATPAPRE